MLSEGNWIKIKVSKDGIYELTDAQLKEFGFSNPAEVKVFGYGGYRQDEHIDRQGIDDLPQVATLRENGKTYFYAKGTTSLKMLINDTDATRYCQPTNNPYSSYGYYFLTDRSDIPALNVTSVSTGNGDIAGLSKRNTDGTDYLIFENEVTNPSYSGQIFLGDNIAVDGKKQYTVQFPAFAGTGKVSIYSNIGIKTATLATAKFTVNGKEMTYLRNTNTKRANISYSSYIYEPFSVGATVNAADIAYNGSAADIRLSYEPGNFHTARIDYVTVGYQARNVIPDGYAQARRFFFLKQNEGIEMGSTTATTHAWLVDNGSLNLQPQEYVLASHRVIVPQESGEWLKFIFFDSSRQQYVPEFVEKVSNQNLHGLATPDMLIITTATLADEAKRLADYRRENDGLDVLIVAQEKIFIEFSSGGQDAIAYRRFAQMLHSRNPEKMQYLLLMGGGTYDNRQIFNPDHKNDQLLTYQSEDSHHTTNSYSSDDFFGVLTSTESKLEYAELDIAVGRIPFFTKKDVNLYLDKLFAYERQAAGKWHNEMLLIGDAGDNNIHLYQNETFEQNLLNDGNYCPNFTKIYFASYTSPENAWLKFKERLSDGIAFGLFVGHGNPYSVSMTTAIMTIEKAKGTRFSIPPIMYFSSCDVGRFDIGFSTVLDGMMLNPDGGIVASIAATRQAFTNQNGYLSNAIAKMLGKDESEFPHGKTLGIILKEAKNTCGDLSKNRLKYHVIGDPSMKIPMASHRVSLTAVNDAAIDGNSISIRPLERISLEGTVTNADGSVNTDFNGTATATLYAPDQKLLDYTYSNSNYTAMSRGAELCYADITVENGQFKGEIAVPAYAAGGTLKLRIAAYDGEHHSASTVFDKLYLDPEAQPAATDTESPVIRTLYIRDAESAATATVGRDITVCAEVYDNFGLNTSKENIFSGTVFSIDGGKSVHSATAFSTENGVTKLEIPVNNLNPGRHVGELTATDYSGNRTSRTLSFIVSSGEQPEIVTDSQAVNEGIAIDVEHAGEETEITVSDMQGNVRFRTTTSTLPYTWDGCDNTGIRLPEGVYNLSATTDGLATPMKKIVVVRQ